MTQILESPLATRGWYFSTYSEDYTHRQYHHVWGFGKFHQYIIWSDFQSMIKVNIYDFCFEISPSKVTLTLASTEKMP